LIKNQENVFVEGANLYSYDGNSDFADIFNIVGQYIERRYGLFNKAKPQIILPQGDIIRELTVADGAVIERFAKNNEEYFPSYE
jgi:hypothetical protein